MGHHGYNIGGINLGMPINLELQGEYAIKTRNYGGHLPPLPSVALSCARLLSPAALYFCARDSARGVAGAWLRGHLIVPRRTLALASCATAAPLQIQAHTVHFALFADRHRT